MNYAQNIRSEKKQSFFHDYINCISESNNIVVQPRMGFSDFNTMKKGLARVKEVNAPTIGTITIDSFTRTGNLENARATLMEKKPLNGYPIVSYGKENNRKLVNGLLDENFPIQVRHGCPQPEHIFKAVIEAGIDATEGGPVSYCFPYSKVPLKDSIASWKNCCEMFAAVENKRNHIESFGGCMMGQLCPPSMLIAITTIEALFFKRFGLDSFSLSLSQGTNLTQDIAALKVLRRIANKYLGNPENWHIVFYTFMGKFPETVRGAQALTKDCAEIVKAGGAQRIIVKTEKEAHQIPTIEDNIKALEYTYENVNLPLQIKINEEKEQQQLARIYEEADFLIDLLLNLSNNIEEGIARAFEKGYWDVPYCLHPDNKKAVTAKLDEHGVIVWTNTGNIPFPESFLKNKSIVDTKLSSQDLIQMLSFNQRKYDLFGNTHWHDRGGCVEQKIF